MSRVTDDLVWVPELEMAIEYHGTWATQLLPPPPFTALRAECQEAPISLEIYALDPEEFRHIDSVGRDLVHSRFQKVTSERYEPTPRGLDVSAMGIERGQPTEIVATICFDNDAFYVVAFSAGLEVLAEQQWRTQAMAASVTFGRHGSYGTGIEGLLNLVGSHLTESQVIMGQSRAQLGDLRKVLPTSKRGRKPADPRGASADASNKVVVDPALLDEASQVGGAAPSTAPPAPPAGLGGALANAIDALAAQEEGLGQASSSIRSVADRDDLADFMARLGETPVQVTPVEVPRWPAPWDTLPNVQPHLRARPGGGTPLALTARGGQRSRASEIITFAQSLPADIGFHAQKVFGVGEAFEHRSQEPFSVVGLDRIPMALEAMLQVRQRELSMNEPLQITPTRRALSPLGRQMAPEESMTVHEALKAMCRDDDATAADMVGWRLGWRQIQARLPAFGLAHHSMLSPARARMLAFTDLEGPLQGTPLPQRIELWRQLDQDERRQVIGQCHKAHLETPLETITSAYLEVLGDHSIDADSKARWALALGPRGSAQEYAGLMASLMRGEVLGAPTHEQAMSLMKPCVGDHLSGLVPGVELTVGKLGQAPGALCGAGILTRQRGAEVAICILAKQVRTIDHHGLAEQIRVLAGQIYLHIMSM